MTNDLVEEHSKWTKGAGFKMLKTCIIVGAGARGKDAYAPYIYESGIMKLVGVAEIDDDKRNEFKNKYDISDEMCFKSYEELFSKGRLADAVIIATQDKDHIKPAKLAMKRGYHILLEKPVSPNESEVLELEKDVMKYDKVFITGYVLRYTPFINKVKKLIEEGAIGDILTMQLNENEGFWHHAHSYVRGQWNNSETSSPLIVAKSCHDFDLISYLIGSRCTSIASYGGNTHFVKENAPQNAPDRCTEGCPIEEECKYNAVKLYTEGQAKYFLHILGCGEDRNSIIEALKTNRYGRCVYKCDNNVCDHQVAAMSFEDGSTAVFTVSAFSLDNNRTLKIMGTEGELGGCMEKGEILLRKFADSSEKNIQISCDDTKHCGGDSGLIKHFVKLISGAEKENKKSIFDSHKMVFAAEESRLTKAMLHL